MGNLMNYDPYIQHLSHSHLLELEHQAEAPPLDDTAPCSGCKLQPYGWMYKCKPCNFTLHVSCTQMPPLIHHPSHPNHPLTLLPTPAYPGGLFNCDACGRRGNGFSYHCRDCEFDIHVVCATKPLSLTHQLHPHQLNLSFYPPYETESFSCDICRNMGSNHWLYRCGACEFDAHLDCATATPRPSAQPLPQPLLRQTYSFPGATSTNHQFQTPVAAGRIRSGPGGSENQHYMHSPSMGVLQINQQPSGHALMNVAAVQGFVDGAAQQVGQNFVQRMTGGGGSDVSIIDTESSFLGSMFGNSYT